MPIAEEQPKQTIQSVWTRPQRRKREQPTLSREQIVSVALELLDADGIDALSMRKLGTRLNAGATSLYTHVTNKDELVELVVDEIYGEVEVPDATGTREEWRSAVISCARSVRSVFHRHPWVVSALGEAGVVSLGPNAMRLSEGMLGIFEEAGFSLEQADLAVNAVVSYTIGVSTTEAAWLTRLARSGMSEQEGVDSLRPAAEQAAQAYPRLSRLYAAQRWQTDSGDARNDNFADGLECVLDGLEMRLRRS
ncbi:TetR/AcrR family transcriptional regulator C-terminal domain-containing protein [Streptomyces sp. NPDC051162]|uniref:TetR/AcrR family transcriptional regulator C-terminal domain-containing protein n=1 Tax=Streptomyces sp. NPDC051162 TaxID=3154747 RepID=UPI00343BEF21